MKVLHRILFSLLFLVAFVVQLNPAAFSCDGIEATSDAPNILFIYLDDLGWRDTGFMGSDFYETPNLDKLAQNGMVFTNAYSCAANCAPARACLLSGQYTPRHQLFNVGTRPRGKAAYRRLMHIPGTDTLDQSLRTWAHVLQDAGYTTATMGKWHLSDNPVPYGFDINIGGTHSGGPPKGYYPPHKQNGKFVAGLKDAPADEYLTDRLSVEATKFISENRSQKWMLYLTHFAVHTPIQAKKELLLKYESKPAGELHQNAKMATMIQSVDDGVGKIIETLKETNQFEKTVIVFFSDNGGYGPATDMDPLKGYKGTYYEGGIRVPFFVHWPGVVDNDSFEEPVIGVDLYPTFCEIAGVDLPDQTLDGVSLMPLLNGSVNSLAPRDLFWHFPAYLQSYGGTGNQDEQRDPLFRSRPCSIIRSGKWKLHQYFESGDLELFDLENDISESNNLATSETKVTQRLLSRLQKWQADIKAPIPREPNPQFNAETERDARAAFERMQSSDR